MKKRHLIGSFGLIVFGTISYANYTFAIPGQQISDLTLANIELMDAPGKDLPTVNIPCKHTGNKDDCCTYYMVSTDGAMVPGYQYFCVNDPDALL